MALMNAKEAKELLFKKEESLTNDLINYLKSRSMEEYFNLKIKMSIGDLCSEIGLSFHDKIISNTSYNIKVIKNYFKDAGYNICDFIISECNIKGVIIEIPLN